MNERVAFGLELRRIRERRGLTLEQMSEQSKVSVTHFAALEAGDLSRWPSGIFRRAFVRSYATMVGLDPDEVLGQFNRIFPDPADGPKAVARIEAALREEALAAAREASPPRDELSVFRLELEPPRRESGLGRLRASWPRIAAATIDVLLALIPAETASMVFGPAWFYPTAAIVALLGHLFYYSVTGTTPGNGVLQLRAREISRGLSKAPGRRRPPSDDSTMPRRPGRRHWTSRLSSHAHRVQH